MLTLEVMQKTFRSSTEVMVMGLWGCGRNLEFWATVGT